jgi:glutaredoxin 3
MPARVVVYTTDYCPYCTRAKRLLQSKNVLFEEIDVTGDTDKRRWLARVTSRQTVPQVFINGTPVGGSDDLMDLNRSGELDRLLAVESPGA